MKNALSFSIRTFTPKLGKHTHKIMRFFFTKRKATQQQQHSIPSPPTVTMSNNKTFVINHPSMLTLDIPNSTITRIDVNLVMLKKLSILQITQLISTLKQCKELRISSGPSNNCWFDFFAHLALALPTCLFERLQLDGYQNNNEFITALFANMRLTSLNVILQADSPLAPHLHRIATNTSITNLSITLCNPTHGKDFLFPHLSMSQVCKLDLHFSDLSVQLVDLLTVLPHTRIKILDLRCSRVNALGCVTLAAKLRECPLLVELSISGNKIGCTGAIALAEAQFAHLQVLNLSQCKIGVEGALAVGRALPGTKLKKLDLSYNDICDSVLADFAKHLPQSRLVSLELYGSTCTEEGMVSALRPVLNDPTSLLLEFNPSFVPNELKPNLQAVHEKEKIICLLSARMVRRIAPHKLCVINRLPRELVHLVAVMLM